MERLCRFPITYNLSRALTERERAALPAYAQGVCPVTLAGAPLQVLREKGVPFVLSAQPCASPLRIPIDTARPHLWRAGDCGDCPSCLARKAD